MFAAQVWTYWMAPPLLAVALIFLIATLVGYHRKVALPQYLADQQRQLEAMSWKRQLQATASGQASTSSLRGRLGEQPRHEQSPAEPAEVVPRAA